MTRAEKQQALEKIAQSLRRSKCPLRAGATQPVAGEGNPNAKIFFIGEAPGKNEDRTGRPFVGAAGRVLNELLALIELEREDVFITSIEKFRPPQNRDPRPEEIMACFPYLQKQIEIIRPKLIICLGRHALRRMMEWEQGSTIAEDLSMKDLRGKVLTGKSGRLYYPVYHPAAALYGFSRSEMEKDFKRIPKILKQR